MFRDFWRGRGSEIVRTYGINLLILEGRYRDVQPALQQLEGMGPDYASSGHFVVGTAYYLQGNPDTAVPYLEKAKATNSPSRKSGVLFYLGEAYAALGNAAEARLAYQQAHEALPNGRFGIRALDRIQLF